MIPHTVFCIAFSRLQADQMIQRLRAAAFPVHDISVLFASGPMIATCGDMTQSFMKQGVPLQKARIYEASIRDGQTLIAVLTECDEKRTLAQQIFTKTGGNDICDTGDISTSHVPAFTPHLVQMTNDRLGVA